MFFIIIIVLFIIIIAITMIITTVTIIIDIIIIVYWSSALIIYGIFSEVNFLRYFNAVLNLESFEEPGCRFLISVYPRELALCIFKSLVSLDKEYWIQLFFLFLLCLFCCLNKTNVGSLIHFLTTD